MKPALFLFLPALACIAHADTIRMRDGTEHEGEVVADKGDHYVVKIQVTKSIRDERKIQKSDVLEIVAERKDEIAFDEIKPLVPTPDLLTHQQYDQRIAMIDGFMKAFPDSNLIKEADAILKTLDSEREVVAAGGLKFEGKMIQASDRASRAYPLDARITAAKVTESKDPTSALRAWSELESKFGVSQAYRDTIPYAKRLMINYLKSVEKSLETIDARIKERDDGLARIDERDRERTKRAIDEQSAKYKALIAKEKEERIKWPTLDPYQKDPIMETQRLLKSEIAKLDKLDLSKTPDGDQAWTDAWDALNTGSDRQAGTTAISAARSARIPQEYITILESKLPEK